LIVVTDLGDVVIARELLSQEEMDDAGDEVGTKRGYKDEESQDEAKKRKLD
jgi:hypothetical protein